MPVAQEIPEYTLDSANSVTVANNEAVYKSTLTLTGSLGDTDTADVEFKLASTSGNIEITQGTGIANINLVWGTF
jgi:glycerol kinase